jgi:hypothetical protein
MIIELEEYRKAKARKAAVTMNYNEELLCVNWNTAVAVAPIALSRATSSSAIPDFPEFHAGVDIDEFVDHIYALATQI